MAQSIITQVSRDSDSYEPCPAPINSGGTFIFSRLKKKESCQFRL